MIRVLAIDFGMAKLGYAVFKMPESLPGYSELLVAGKILTKKDKNNLVNIDNYKRLEVISKGLEEIIVEYKPEVIVTDMLNFYDTARNSVMKLAMVLGMVYEKAFKYEIDLCQYSAQSLKSKLTGSKKASKIEVVNYIHDLYPNIKLTKDIADAIGLGIVFIRDNGGKLWVKQKERKQRLQKQ